MGHCKHRVMDKCRVTGAPCTFSKDCFEPEDIPTRTNADRIRDMSDEELAKFLANPCTCNVDLDVDGNRECGNDLCIKYLLDWLRQPAEEGHDG